MDAVESHDTWKSFSTDLHGLRVQQPFRQSLTTVLHCRNGKHVLVAYIMKPKAGYDYLATAAHFAAESSTGPNVNVCTTDDFTKSVDALVYYIDPDNEEMKIAYPTLLFDRNITDGRGMMCSFLTLAIGNNQGSLTTRQLTA